MALIPAIRKVNWTPGTYVGVPGGMPLPAVPETCPPGFQDVTLAPYSADPTGVVDCTAVVQSALNAWGQIWFPPGTYLGSGVITIGHAYDYAQVRGCGPGVTTLKGFSFEMGSQEGWIAPSTPTDITAGLSKGSTSITVADASEMTNGALLRIEWADQTDNTAISGGAIPCFAVGGNDPVHGLRRQIVKITSKSGNNLTIYPPLFRDPDAGLGANCSSSILWLEGVGISHMTFDMQDSFLTRAILFIHAYASWVYNVEIMNMNNYGISFDSGTLMCEVRRCYIHNRRVGGSNGAGLLFNQVSSCLIEDNIFYDLAPSLEINSGSSGNVFGYNCFDNPWQGTFFNYTIDGNHGPWNSYNLYEGNITPVMIWDSYFGGSEKDTIYRNWLPGTDHLAEHVYGYTCAPKRFSFELSFCGNVFGISGFFGAPWAGGQPNSGNDFDNGSTSEFLAGDFPADWKMTGQLTTRTNNTQGVITLITGSIRESQVVSGRPAYIISSGYGQPFTVITLTSTPVEEWPGSFAVLGPGGTFSFTAAGGVLPALNTVFDIIPSTFGYQELNSDVENTAVDKGNSTYTSNGSFYTTTGLGGDTLVDSQYTTKAELVARGVVYGDLPFPFVDPENPDILTVDQLPAGYRFIHGEDPVTPPDPGENAVTFGGGSGSTTFSGSGTVTFS